MRHFCLILLGKKEVTNKKNIEYNINNINVNRKLKINYNKSNIGGLFFPFVYSVHNCIIQHGICILAVFREFYVFN